MQNICDDKTLKTITVQALQDFTFQTRGNTS